MKHIPTKIKNLIFLLGINFALLFVLGINGFKGFLAGMQSTANSMNWQGNHSLSNYAHGSVYIILVFLCKIGWLYINWKSKGWDVRAIIYCALMALLLPVSNDYTLPILIFPAILLFEQKLSYTKLLACSLVYSSILFSYASKTFMINNALALLILTGLILLPTFKTVEK